METLDLARWQFAATTIYHFMFVPLTIGLSTLVAVMQTAWVRTDNPTYLRMTRFWGKLLLVNFAIGVVTGIVQEFQFGMAWSDYSRFVGDVFGAPLAIEGLVAFMMESTFLGLWMFGWDRLPKKVHLATIWCVAIGTAASAYFILAANSWMQHPVGYRLNPVTGRAELESIWAVLTNDTALFAFSHTILGALGTAASVLVGISVWHLYRERKAQRGPEHVDVFRKSARLGLVVMLAATTTTMAVGHFNAQLMTRQQPMKMAAAEALWDTTKGAPLSLLTLAPLEKKPERPSFELDIPKLASFMATNDPNGTVKGINQLQAELENAFGPGEYYPIVGLTYWSFRAMMGAGFFMIFAGAVGLLGWKRRIFERRWFQVTAMLAMAAGFLAHIFGWMFTEIGRQPWVVYGLQKTSDAVSHLAPGVIATSLAVFVVLYGVLAFIEVRLFLHYVRKGPEPDHVGDDGRPAMAITY
ncbi:MAG: cytochrome ubiquinol oxidase subunit I [Solirubrobacteraceae bacterium]|nr:cytochrome ubiquinol oxidase subunit I [Solirubrobacteraceae bacterium]